MAFKTILIVEDDPSIRGSLKLLYEGEGYPVLCANHGQEALELLRSSPPSKIGLILLDFRMPVMDGTAFLFELKRSHPEILGGIPIFTITAGRDTHRGTIKTTGFLEKPFDLDELFRVAARYCRGN